ncbi:MAG: glycosyltransferase family 39 protein [Vicinamibacteria bacterium]|jgi:4-amino-4-deoxy-L-arabinose transferase-like glycosyltransferase|nr:glycosyltransferase family 39 protein [Vicinamibacteria bacterium]
MSDEPTPLPIAPVRHQLPILGALCLFGLTVALLLLRLGQFPLIGPDEPRYARVAVELYRSGNWITPTLQGSPWLEKPILYYWLAAAGYHLFGEGEFAARLPSVLAGLLLTGSIAVFAARLDGARAGLHAGFICATSVLTYAYGRAASMDMLLAATVSAAVGLIGLRLMNIAGQGAIRAAYAFIGLAVLAKGPLGLLLPGLIVAAYIAWTRKWASLRSLIDPIAIALFCIVALPWYLLVWRENGFAFIQVFFLNHNLQRFTSTIHNHPGRFSYYIEMLPLGFFPWVALLPLLFWRNPNRSRGTDDGRTYILLWLLLPFLFFSSAGSKLPGYILPCMAPLALLLGRRMAEIETAGDGHGRRVATGASAFLLLILGSAVGCAPWLVPSRYDVNWSTFGSITAWTFLFACLASATIFRQSSSAFALLRVGAAGLLVLVSLTLSGWVARHESGRDVLLPAQGEEVLIVNAWRNAWMAGYFYNDAHVRELDSLSDAIALAQQRPVLLLCGPLEQATLIRYRGLDVRLLAEGPRRNVLLRIARPPDARAASPSS